MDRRAFGTSMLMGAFGAAAAPALAQRGYPAPMDRGMMPMGSAEQRHAVETLAVGSVALQTSQMAQGRAARPLVRQFADFEVEEQTTIAQIINEMTGGLPPPPPSPYDARMMADLQRMRGEGFDRMYLLGQMDGHRRLLGIQERYLREGRNPDQRHVAMLARGRIREHLADLERLQSGRG